jgi:hypothetical protein
VQFFSDDVSNVNQLTSLLAAQVPSCPCSPLDALGSRAKQGALVIYPLTAGFASSRPLLALDSPPVCKHALKT